ncbi:hypothetical protein ACJZL1_03315 [Wolbachia endosymbiont of Rhagoletis indifferens]|uniref:hypothetical protein n=1 Tax=unclassified Wolbachia TaxID=2640676 RepID=UPI0022325286|nr:hypothetical protein [Wolbachia endosymbiont (group A) of Bibio marci]
MNLKDGLGLCPLGMFDRIIYSLSCLETKNNFLVQINGAVNVLTPKFTERFLKEYCNYKKLKILVDKFEDFYSEDYADKNNISDEVKSNINQSIIEIREFVFKELYIKFYEEYGKSIQRGAIKQKLRELVTDDSIKEAVYYSMYNIEIPAEPPTYLERVKEFFGGHARSPAA